MTHSSTATGTFLPCFLIFFLSHTLSLSLSGRLHHQEILKSLVAAPLDGGEAGLEVGPTPYHPDPALKTHPMLPMQFHSFDR